MGKVKEWARRHKKAIAAITIVAVVTGAVILIINGKRVKVPINKLAEVVAHTLPETENIARINVDGVIKTFPRAEFIRHLHPGWHASPEKIAEAARLGIKLKPGETFVNACMVAMRTAA